MPLTKIESFLQEAAIDTHIFGNMASATPLGGGCICEAYRLEDTQGRKVFLKTGRNLPQDLLRKEAEGLEALAEVGAIRIPRVYAVGATEKPFLILEYFEETGPGSSSEETLGHQLAQLHRVQSSKHGWKDDNYAGPSPQKNQWTSSWTEFFCHQRLHPQFEWAIHKGLSFPKLHQFLERVQEVLQNRDQVSPSLLHGDLWSGNVSFLKNGDPILYDPAVYYGDREMDIAMTRLFGGFSAKFYEAYAESFPFDAESEKRIELYNLYPLLNHFNLFGGGYGQQVLSVARSFL